MKKQELTIKHRIIATLLYTAIFLSFCYFFSGQSFAFLTDSSNKYNSHSILNKNKKEINIMEKYLNLGGDSGVRFYEIGEDFIRVKFSDGSIYEYTEDSCGKYNLNEMIRLAKKGEGLNSFINRVVKYKYKRKIR